LDKAEYFRLKNNHSFHILPTPLIYIII